MSYVFFFKQKTAYEMRISDWSSDVCSSDLQGDGALHQRRVAREAAEERVAVAQLGDRHGERSALAAADDLAMRDHARIAGLDVVAGQAGLHAVGVDGLHVGGLSDDHVVAHDVLGQLAGVPEVDGE